MTRITSCIPLFFLILAAAGPVLGAEEAPWKYRELWDIVWRIINFLVLAYILYRIGKKPLLSFISSRRDEIAVEIKNSERSKAEAEKEYQEILSEVSKADEKIRELTELIESQSEAQKGRILNEAQEAAERIIAHARMSAEFLLRKARQELHEELVDMAVRMAEEKIRAAITDKDQRHLADRYVQNLMSGHA